MNPATIELTTPDISCAKCRENIEGGPAGEPAVIVPAPAIAP